ncbi:hypothetical protein BGX21_003215, partial [Mortierella sp. AD011]
MSVKSTWRFHGANANGHGPILPQDPEQFNPTMSVEVAPLMLTIRPKSPPVSGSGPLSDSNLRPPDSNNGDSPGPGSDLGESSGSASGLSSSTPTPSSDPESGESSGSNTEP